MKPKSWNTLKKRQGTLFWMVNQGKIRTIISPLMISADVFVLNPWMKKNPSCAHFIIKCQSTRDRCQLCRNELREVLFMRKQYSLAAQCECCQYYFVFPWSNTLKWQYSDARQKQLLLALDTQKPLIPHLNVGFFWFPLQWETQMIPAANAWALNKNNDSFES